jgi:pyrrolidone-carboxylate peptidase
MEIIQTLQGMKEEGALDPTDVDIESLHIIDVNSVSCDAHVQRIYDEHIPQNPRNAVIHMGVWMGLQKFNLETCCVNNLLSEERNGRICEERPSSHRNNTQVHADKMVKYLGGKGFEVQKSLDAGTYFCNYIYYNSLERACVG